jgi:hypothetical protein
MHCICCDHELSDWESTRKSVVTGQYLDMCQDCVELGDTSDFTLLERADLLGKTSFEDELESIDESFPT